MGTRSRTRILGRGRSGHLQVVTKLCPERAVAASVSLLTQHGTQDPGVLPKWCPLHCHPGVPRGCHGLIKPSVAINCTEHEPGKRIKEAQALVLRWSLAFSPPEEGFQGIGGCESEMEQGLGRKQASWLWGLFLASMARHSVANPIWVRQTGIRGGVVIIRSGLFRCVRPG